MKFKKIVSIGTLVSLLLVGLLITIFPAKAANGPKTPNMLIHIFNSDTAEFEAFQSATGADAIDFVDCPLPKSKIDLWQTTPYDAYVRMDDYSEIGIYRIDLNNQRWPTGVTEPRTFDPATGTYKHYFGTNEPWDSKAKEFRKAISYLSNKNKWINDILKGYGHRLDTMVPVGALAGYTDYAGLNALGLIYNYNPVKAAQVLNDAGFTQGTTANPDYDPATPGSAPFLRTDPRYGGNLQPLVFYIRMDDVLRRDMGRDLTAQLRKAGIQINAIETDKTVCYNYVMVLYDYHLYTGSSDVSGLDADIPNSLYKMFHSSQYWGGSSTGYYGGTGWSYNYIGFNDATHDGYLEQGKFGDTFDAVKNGGLLAQQREAELVHSIPAFDRIAVKAFKDDWTGVVNNRGYGVDNRWSFLNGINTVNTPQNPADNEIDYGFKSRLESPNPITSEWIGDAYICGFIYDTMLGRNPYDLSMDYGFAAQAWSFNPADTPYPSATFTLRPGTTFHNGDPVTPEDVKFSLEFQKACGPGVAWSYSEYEPIVYVKTKNDVGYEYLGDRDVKVYFEDASYWAVHWAGFCYILNHNVWMRASNNLGWGYTRGMTDFNAFTNRMAVRNYQPWLYDGDGDGTMDYKEDGSGPWVFESYAPSGQIELATSLYFSGFTNYIVPQSAISGYLGWSFNMIGDVDLNGEIDRFDMYAIQRALGTNSGMLPWGTGWDQYNPNADIDTGTWDMINQVPLTQGDGIINAFDLGKWGLNMRGDAVAVNSVTPSKTEMGQGYSLAISVSLSGSSTQSFKVTAYYGSRTITTDEWNAFWSWGDADRDGYINTNDYDVIMAAYGSIQCDPNWNPNADFDQDLAVSDMDLDIWTSNNGLDIWSMFGLAVVIGTQTTGVFVQKTLTFTLDTMSVSPGTYMISAYASPLPSEDPDDNGIGDVAITIFESTVAVYPEITVGPPPSIGEIFTVDITIANVEDLYTWQAGMSFDPSLLEAVSIDEGEFLKRSGVSTLWTPGSIDNTMGIIHYSACSITGPNPGVTGAGQLMSITFLVKASGSSTLQITDVLLLDSNLQSIQSIYVDDGHVQIHAEDVAILSATLSATEAYPTWIDPTIYIEAVVENQGTRTETFTVEAYSNDVFIGTRTVTLDPGVTKNLHFYFDVSGATEGNHEIRIEAATLLGEIDTADNTFIAGTVTVKHPGDANGDSILNAYDVGILAKAWGTSVGQPLYDPRADFNGDGTIDTLDHDILKAHWP